MQQVSSSTLSERLAAERMPEARCAYYRRCQVFRRNGEQCKAPAEIGAQICHAHASQLAMAVRRERERRAMLAEAVAEMRRRDKPECEMADLFTDFKGIQVTLAVIKGTIDCRTAGQMLVHLQTCSKLLWQIHCKGHKSLPLIHTDEADLKKMPKPKPLPRIHMDDADVITKSWGHEEKQSLPQICAEKRRLEAENRAARLSVRRASDCAGAKVLQFEVTAFGGRSWAHGPPESKAA